MMKRLVAGGVALIALAVSGWSSASALDVPELCGGFDILKHSENRVYRGEFKSKDITLETALVVTPVTSNGDTVVFYVWGVQPQWDISEAGCRPGTGASDGDTLTIFWENVRLSYTFSGDNASVRYTWSGWTRDGSVTLSAAPAKPAKAVKTVKTVRTTAKTTSTVVPRKRRIMTEQEYRDAVVGKRFASKHGYFVVHDDGTMTGNFRSGKLVGKWTWKDQFFCRSGKVGDTKLGWDCQVIFMQGDTMTSIRKKGKGKTSPPYRVQESD